MTGPKQRARKHQEGHQPEGRLRGREPHRSASCPPGTVCSVSVEGGTINKLRRKYHSLVRLHTSTWKGINDSYALSLRWNTLSNWNQPLIIKKLASYTFSTLPWSRCSPKMLPVWAEQQTRQTAGRNWQTDALPLQSKRTEAVDFPERSAEQSRTLFCFLFFFSARSLSGVDSADSSRDRRFAHVCFACQPKQNLHEALLAESVDLVDYFLHRRVCLLRRSDVDAASCALLHSNMVHGLHAKL